MSLEGQQLGRYRLLRLLGSGGMGEVYLAEDAGIARQVAIKVIRGDVVLRSDEEESLRTLQLFQREMKTVAALNHSHILPLYDYGEAVISGITLPYMVMPYGEDGTLASWLKERSSQGPLAPEDVAYMVEQAGDALQYAHERQIVHRDVKPSNFLLRRNRNDPNRPDLLLADFGLARLNSAASSGSMSIAGSPPYMAPEQWRGRSIPATDQYMLAAMAYELLTGRPPFQGTLEQLVYKHLTEQPEPPGKLNPRVSPALDAVIMRGLAKAPEDRYPSVEAFARAFDEAVQSPNRVKRETYATVDASDAVTGIAGQSASYNTIHADSPSRVSRPVQPPVAPGGNLTHTQAVTGGPHVETTQRGVSLNVMASRRGFQCSFAFLIALFVLVSVVSIPVLIGLNRPSGGASALPGNATATSVANATTTPAATSTAGSTDTHNPYPPFSGSLVINDALQNNSGGYAWDVQPTQFGTCTFTSNGYQAVATQNGAYHYCAARNTNFANFAYEVHMTIVSGDCGGIIFRADFTNFKYYYFSVCQNGSYSLLVFTGQNQSKTLQQGSSPAIHTGLNVQNVVAVSANGSSIALFVSRQPVTSITDATYSQGQIGVLAENDTHNPTEVVFSDMRVWRF
ncbi:MAG TPA: serine/threonine-protein kinase [Ktedonobacteraceae bacterium]|jgi:serine/threonine protein kinase|nr:serine/threonine-protein kinase [Ktedonobacteraceae bacterium]